MEGFHKVTIYAAGAIEGLANSLTEVGGGATVIPTTGYWNSGLGVLKEPAVKIEVIAGADRVFRLIEATDEWLDGSDQAAVLLEIAPTFTMTLTRRID